MRQRSILVLGPALLLVAAAIARPEPAQACGPYGASEHDVTVHVRAHQPASDGISVRARCGDHIVDATPQGETTFVLFGLHGDECIIEATAHECYTSDRTAQRRVSLPRERLVLAIPDHSRS